MALKQIFETGLIAIRNLILGGNLAALTLIGRPKRMIDYVSESLFLYRIFSQKRGLPQKNVFDVLASDGVATVKFGNLAGANWFLPKASYTVDLVSLSLICQLVSPRVIFEIGTLKGYTALHLALNTPDDARIFTLDLPRDTPVQPRLRTTSIDERHVSFHAETERYVFEGTELASKITCLTGDSAAFDFSPYHGKVDFFFIDGAHSYDYVRSDTFNALRCCHSGSVIAWHDFGRMGVNGVSRWLGEFSKNRQVYSIPGGSLAFMLIPEAA